MACHAGTCSQGLHVAFNTGCSGQHLTAPERAAGERPRLSGIPEHQHPLLSIKGSSTGAPYPEPRSSWAACRLRYSWRWGWPSTCRKLEAGIQQGIVPEKIPGYTAKTDRALFQISSALCPTSHPQPIWLGGRGRCGPTTTRLQTCPQSLLIPPQPLHSSRWLLFWPVLAATHQHTHAR